MNRSGHASIVHVSFGAGSAITGWSFCAPLDSGAGCVFGLGSEDAHILPLEGKYLNASIAFDRAPNCGATIAELNINQTSPPWYDTSDVSLVNGYSGNIEIAVFEPKKKAVVLGPPVGKDGNEKVFGVFPYGCDICTGRVKPPCGIAPGGLGCKAGTQYKPDVPCQYQGLVMSGGERYEIIYRGER